MTRTDYRAMLAALSDAELWLETATRIRHYLDYRRDRATCECKDRCWNECMRRGATARIWDSAVEVAKQIGRHGRIMAEMMPKEG